MKNWIKTKITSVSECGLFVVTVAAAAVFPMFTILLFLLLFAQNSLINF